MEPDPVVAEVRAALREVLYGLTFPDFMPRMGCSRKDAAEVFDALPRTSIAEPDRTEIPRPPDASER